MDINALLNDAPTPPSEASSFATDDQLEKWLGPELSQLIKDSPEMVNILMICSSSLIASGSFRMRGSNP